jgi:hypothetical protein
MCAWRLASHGMFGSRRRLGVAAAVVAVLVGVVVHGAEVRLDGGSDRAGDRASVAVVDAAHAGVAPVAVRARTLAGGELGSLAPSSRTRLGALALALVSGLVPVAAAWWCLARPDRRLASPLRRSSLAALRAPPVFVFA